MRYSSTKQNTLSNQGFSLIELIITLFIISLLAMLAMPSYFQYHTRAKIETDFSNASSPIKSNLTQQYYTRGSWPESNAEALLDDKDAYKSTWLASIEVGTVPVDGSITLTFDKTKLPQLGDNNTIVLYPTVLPGSQVSWACDEGSLEKTYRPHMCK